jgi:hypothetical protein
MFIIYLIIELICELKSLIWLIGMQPILIFASVVTSEIWWDSDTIDEKIDETCQFLDRLDKSIDRYREVKVITGSWAASISIIEWETIINNYRENLYYYDMIGGNIENEDI